MVAPVRERGLKYDVINHDEMELISRSREGAWIEIRDQWAYQQSNARRSREGAWIEIRDQWAYQQSNARRSREGAWIEIIPVNNGRTTIRVAPVRERGLKSAHAIAARGHKTVAPARERGLKFINITVLSTIEQSLPRGSVD